MISRMEGKNIAGKIFVNEFDKNFLKKNIERLNTTECLQDSELVVDFCMDPKETPELIINEEGICIKETCFPEVLLTVAVNLKNQQTKILFKAEKVN